MENLKIYLLIGLGGFLGSVSRYISTQAISNILPNQNGLGTWMVNVFGSFLIGFLYANFVGTLSSNTYLFLTTGILGGFTTFSAFSLDSFIFLKSGQWFSFLLYFFASSLGSLIACSLGYYLVSSR